MVFDNKVCDYMNHILRVGHFHNCGIKEVCKTPLTKYPHPNLLFHLIKKGLLSSFYGGNTLGLFIFISGLDWRAVKNKFL